MEKIKFYVKRSYGNDRAYFADEQVAVIWRRLTGRATLSPQDLKDLKSFGADFEKIESPEDKFKEGN